MESFFSPSLTFEGDNAGTAVITIEGASTEDQFGAIVSFGSGSAAQSTITAQGATVSGFGLQGLLGFGSSADADTATLIATGGTNGGNGGRITFSDTSSGDLARLELFGNGELDIGLHHRGGVGVGSIEGDGLVFLGDLPLTIAGSLSTTFSGIIQDGGLSGRTGGSFVYSGGGTLTLSGANTYTGGTTITSGTLIAANSAGSATGTSRVTVSGGTLGGGGTITGPVVIGGGASLAPAAGTTTRDRLTIENAVTLNSGATYTYTFKANRKHARTDLVIANGVTINGATLTINATTQGRMKLGLILNVISNTSANAIGGTFTNLPDGAIVTVNGNNLQASYEGSDGNDLTLEVVA